MTAGYAMVTIDAEQGYQTRRLYYGLLHTQLVSLLVDKSLRLKDVAGFNPVRPEETGPKVTAGKAPASTSSDASAAEKEETTTKAQLITLTTTDVSIICHLFTFQGLSLIVLPLEVFFGGWLIYRILGISALVGLSAGLVTTPVTFLLGRLTAKYQDKIQSSRDRRIAILREILTAIRMVKLGAREGDAQRRIERMRNVELDYLKKSVVTDAVMTMILMWTPCVIAAVTFAHYTL